MDGVPFILADLSSSLTVGSLYFDTNHVGAVYCPVEDTASLWTGTSIAYHYLFFRETAV